MKQILIVFLLLAGLCNGLKAADSSSVDLRDLEQQVENLRNELEVQSQFNSNVKKELELDFRELSYGNWGRSLAIIGAILVVGLALWGGWQGARKAIIERAETRAESLVGTELDKRVPALVQTETAKVVTEIIEERGDLLAVIIQDYERRLAIKQKRKIVVLAENEVSGENIAQYLKEKRFQNVFVQVPEDSQRVDADLVIFNREKKTEDQNLERLHDSFVNAYIKDNWRDQKLIYFGPKNDALHTRTVNMGFANYRQKLEGNIMQMFEAPGESDFFPS